MTAAPWSPACVLVTGGAGFIGSNLIRWVLAEHPEVVVVNLDALTYAANVESLADVAAAHEGNRYRFVHGDVRDASLVASVLRGDATGRDGARIPPPDAVLHLAAESHVDRSIIDASAFVSTNVEGTRVLLEAVRGEADRRGTPLAYVQVSTDEVYGALGPLDAAFTETSPLAPNSPYAASKAGADLLVRAFANTYGLPAAITRCSNNYGPYQFPEKLIPLMLTRALTDQSLPVYGDGMQVRDWLHVTDHAAALWAVLTARVTGVMNVGGDCERTNLAVIRTLLASLGKSESLIRHVDDRAGHDRRYAIDSSALAARTGWRPRVSFEAGLAQTVAWYVNNRAWWHNVQSEAYRAANALYLRAI